MLPDIDPDGCEFVLDGKLVPDDDGTFVKSKEGGAFHGNPPSEVFVGAVDEVGIDEIRGVSW